MKKSIFLLIILTLFLVSCENEPEVQYIYRAPERMDDGLDTGTLEGVNIDLALIEEAVSRIHSGQYPEVHSLLILKDNKLVLEEYFWGHEFQWDGPGHHGAWVTWDRTMPHDIMSGTKSITSTCIGIAIKHGFIESVHQPIFDYLPDHQRFNVAGKGQITIEHLLTMTSGLEWKEWGASNTDLENDIFKLWIECEDQVACILAKPLIEEPGTDFTYSGGNMVLLAEIIKNATGMDIEEFSGKYLFEPLGIDPPVWAKFDSGVIDGSGGIKITPRDMVKFGLTFLNNGVWKGDQIVSEGGVEKSATTYPGNTRINVPGEESGRVGYAYTWWTKEYSGEDIKMYYAGGWGGQLIMVLPERNTVVIFTGGNYVTSSPDFKIFEKYVLSAIE